MIDEELLKPSRELLALLRGEIAALEAETFEKISRYKADDPEYARELWSQFNRAVEPMRRQQEAVLKTITDHYAAHPLPPQIMRAGSLTDTPAGT